MATKLCKLLTCHEGLPPIMLLHLSIIWSCEITWQTKPITTPLLQYLWLLNLIVNTEVSEDSVATDNEIDGFTKAGLLRKKHINNLFFGHLNINSLINKRKFLEPPIRQNFDIFLVSKTKLDSSFPWSEFTIPGDRLFRKDEYSLSEPGYFL